MTSYRSLKLFSRSLIVLITLVQASEYMIWRSVHAEAVPRPLANKDLKKLNQLDKAYLDTYTILRRDNECSRLFGGPGAIDALTEMVSQLKPVYLDRSIAIRMSGRTTNFQSHRTGFSYRLFEKAEINLDGPFYRQRTGNQSKVSVVNEFHSYTRESRVVVLLHELGHLVRGADKKWLLPDDGANPGLSLQNSERVLDACHEEIAAVTKLSAEEQTQSDVYMINE